MFTKLEKQAEKLLKKLHIRKSFFLTILYGVMAWLLLLTLVLAYDVTSAVDEMEANALVNAKLRDHNYTCLEDFNGEGVIDGYDVKVVDKGQYRSVTLRWNTFFIPKSRVFTFFTTSGCLFD